MNQILCSVVSFLEQRSVSSGIGNVVFKDYMADQIEVSSLQLSRG